MNSIQADMLVVMSVMLSFIFKDGFYLIYNPEQYKLKKGVEFKVTPRPKNKQCITNNN